MIVNDLVTPVIYKLRQRFDLQTSIPYYIAVAMVDLSMNVEIEELKTTGPLSNFIPMQSEYPMTGYDINGIQGNPFVQAPEDVITFIDSWFIYFDTSGVITPGVSTGKELDKRDLRAVEPMSKILGIPTLYTIQGKGPQGRIIVGQMPDNPYACQMRYQRQHPFNIPYGQMLQSLGNSTITAKVAASKVYFPDDWSDIITYFAAEKCADDVGMNEISQMYHQKLFGYKDKRGSDMPGLIMAKQTQEERNTLFNSRAMRPVVRRFTGR
jgi:hypothetical protein